MLLTRLIHKVSHIRLILDNLLSKFCIKYQIGNIMLKVFTITCNLLTIFLKLLVDDVFKCTIINISFELHVMNIVFVRINLLGYYIFNHLSFYIDNRSSVVSFLIEMHRSRFILDTGHFKSILDSRSVFFQATS